LFAIYAVISLVPVLVLGIVLAASFRSEANRRGISEGRAEAVLVARTAVQPLLSGRSLSSGISASELASLRRLTTQAVHQREVLRLRVRDLAGRVVFSDDGSGFQDKPEAEAIDAARGATLVRLTHLNADTNDTGSTGVASVEVYLPLTAGSPGHRVGVLELYLPYGPIGRDLSSGLSGLYRDLAIGLAVLYLVLFAITASVSRGLRRESARNAFLAHHDTLTELPNRTLFHKEAKRAAAMTGGGTPVAIAIIDLDRFKDVNDTLGHHNGDRLLSELARRVAANMRPLDVVARLGGDEFGVILRDVGDAERVLWRLRDVIDREIEVSGLPLSLQASIGFVIAPEDGTDVDTLLQRADVAMYVAKAQHAGVLRYDAALDHYDAANLSLVAELRHAIDDDQLVLHYQPQAGLGGGEVNAVEALVRWQHPTQGLLYPDRFLPLAEQTDVIDKLTSWVLRTALTQIGGLGDPDCRLSVAVNVSARSVGRMALADEVIETLEQLGVPAERLIIEVTETALLHDPERAAGVLARLAEAGVKISLDDFGRGQTSLGYLSELPIHELKIDRSFIADMLENASHGAIVRSIIDLGHNLALRVVGEGVETDEILASLRESGCDIAQGFLLARPMPFEQLAEWLVPIAVPATA
jgi:diguanylate cyclase (GGDEF)-like protein